MPRVQITEIVAGRNGAGYLLGVDGASVQVNVRGGSAATVYAGATGGTTLPNPLTSDNGRIDGWLDEGSYDLIPTVSGVVGDTIAFEARAAYPSGASDGQILTWDSASSGVKWAGANAVTAALPWKIDVNVFTPAATNTNFSTVTQASNFLMGGVLQSSGAQNDEVGWDVVLAAGTWTFSVVCTKGTTRGTANVSLDGISIGTIDMYGASTTDNNLLSITGVTVATTGKKRLLVRMASKNVSASSYVGTINLVSMLRTA